MMGEIVVWGAGPGGACRAGAVCRAPSPGGEGCRASCSRRINGCIPKGERDGKSDTRLWADVQSSAGELCRHHPP